MATIVQKLRDSAAKAAVVGATGAVLTMLVLDGGRPVPIMGQLVPKFAVNGVVLAGASVATDFILPVLTPYVSIGSPQLRKFDQLVLSPLVIGAVTLGLESVLCPQASEATTGVRGGLVKEIAVGASSAIVAAYVSAGMGWVPSVIF